jgi:hypothetical protein
MYGHMNVKSFETSANIYGTTRCNIPEDSNFHSHHLDNVKPLYIH